MEKQKTETKEKVKGKLKPKNSLLQIDNEKNSKANFLKKETEGVLGKEKISCADKLCPFHGIKPVKLRGRIFEGEIIKKFPGRVVIQFERMLHVPKYERYEKRKTKLHARLPDCLKDAMHVGDYIKIAECRPLSKIIHFIATEKIRSKMGGEKI